MKRQDKSSNKGKEVTIKSPRYDQTRGAGILLHITSLPSRFGIGDLGPNAHAFARFLYRSGQTYWQVLPLNPTGINQQHSPYDACSSFAGNILLISPDLLVDDGLLTLNEVKSFYQSSEDKVDFRSAEKLKNILFDRAYHTFCNGTFTAQKKMFSEFCKVEAYWLNDFALYQVLVNQFNKEWYQWPSNYKFRDSMTLQKYVMDHVNEIQKIKWLQFVFFTQWNILKEICHALKIKIFGDLPFYVSYNSADVWSHPEIFNLDKKGNMKTVAGLPPDYYNKNGQRWGMPTFRWDVIKRNKYDWWIQRVTKNIKTFDILRLDHFRAFSSFWEIPAKEKIATKGTWKIGPGSSLFRILKNALGKLPFVAEDLGDIDDNVRHLRDEFNLSGMKVLQYAFYDNTSTNEFLPHNYASENFVVYTGTHDNNTTKGWFTNDIKRGEQKRIKSYLGKNINANNVHYKLSELGYGSIARVVILPVQDILGLDRNSRMNIPGTTGANWLWRQKPGTLTKRIENQLLQWATLYNRLPV